MSFFVHIYFWLQVARGDLDEITSDNNHVFILDYTLNSVVLAISLIRLMSIPISIKIDNAFQRDISWSSYYLQSGFSEFILTIICFALEQSIVGLWFRIIRLVLFASVFDEAFPVISVILVS